MSKYRVAIVGCGARASAHIEAYQYIPDAQVVACCDPNLERREMIADRYGLTRYADAAEMMRAERPDIVNLITWPDMRVELMTLVSEHRVPMCIVEKPIAVGVDDWWQLRQLSAVTGTKFAVSHQVRWQQDLQRCQREFTCGNMGEPLFLDISSGLNIVGQGTHTLNYGRFLLGDPMVTQVFGNVSGWEDPSILHPGPLMSTASLTFDNGMRALWTSGPVSPVCGDPEVEWQHVRIAAYAEKGFVRYEEFGRWHISGPDRHLSGDYGGMDTWAHNNILAQAGLHRAVLAWHENDALEPGTSLRQSLHEWAVVLAVYQSALDHQPIDMCSFNPTSRLMRRLGEAMNAPVEGGSGVSEPGRVEVLR